MYSLMQEPFGKIYRYNKLAQLRDERFLDAIYIPSLASRNVSDQLVNSLLQFSKEIVFIYSNEVGCFSSSDSSFVRTIKISEHSAFLNAYSSKEANSNIAVEWRSDFDIPHKRSFALKEARERNYKYILMLDDDLHISRDNILCARQALNDGVSVVGFHVVDYPDVSTIDHLERIVLNRSNTISMTGSCMFINVEAVEGDFSNIYNEDLFFFLSQRNIDDVVSGGCIFQNKSDPWLDLKRVKHEQFGDLIYDAFKKQFLAKKHEKINWSKEIEERIIRINKIQNNTNDRFIRLSLNEAIIALNSIKVPDITRFIVESYLPRWIKDLCIYDDPISNESFERIKEVSYVKN